MDQTLDYVPAGCCWRPACPSPEVLRKQVSARAWYNCTYHRNRDNGISFKQHRSHNLLIANYNEDLDHAATQLPEFHHRLGECPERRQDNRTADFTAFEGRKHGEAIEWGREHLKGRSSLGKTPSAFIKLQPGSSPQNFLKTLTMEREDSRCPSVRTSANRMQLLPQALAYLDFLQKVHPGWGAYQFEKEPQQERSIIHL